MKYFSLYGDPLGRSRVRDDENNFQVKLMISSEHSDCNRFRYRDFERVDFGTQKKKYKSLSYFKNKRSPGPFQEYRSHRIS
jgi:hypothetical protein